MTTRERREARAARLRTWAEGRERRAEQEFDKAHAATAGIPFGQPIIVGHYSERRHRGAIARGDAAMGRAVESSRMASSMVSRADNIERATEHAIFSDDPDARERLTERIAALEAQRDRIKAENAAFRKAHREQLKGLTAGERDLASPHRAFVATNLTGNISRLRKRLADLDRTPVDRQIIARYASVCADCGAEICRGDSIRYSKAYGARCAVCPTNEED